METHGSFCSRVRVLGRVMETVREDTGCAAARECTAGSGAKRGATLASNHENCCHAVGENEIG